MTKTITANIPARTLKGQTKTFSYPARTQVFTCDAEGQWTAVDPEYGDQLVREAEVIDCCRKATNWLAIKAEHFPMHGFHS